MAFLSNCFLFAAKRTIFRGGALILVPSDAGPYLHALWAEKLPHDMQVEHFSPRDKSKGIHLEPLFIGDVAYHVGTAHTQPKKVRGFSVIYLFFWMINFLGWAVFLALMMTPVYFLKDF